MSGVKLVSKGAPIKSGQVLSFLAVRNEWLRLPAVLDHHRRLGVDRLVIVDNASDDGTEELLAAAPDVQLYRTTGSYAASGFGLEWLHPLLDEMGHNHWVLTLDADELFVYPHCELIGLHDFCHFLDRAGADSVFAILLDMYSDKSIAATSYCTGDSLLDTCPFFDPGPYRMLRVPAFPTFTLYGGPRARLFWSLDTPFLPPTVSKVPLVKWQCGRRYYCGTHCMEPAPTCLAGVSGALLHFKFLGDFHERAASEVTRGEHFAGGREYKLYLQRLKTEPELSVHFAGSVRYQGCDQLVSLQLCRTLADFDCFAKAPLGKHATT